MKTAISVPDETFREATERAASLGMSRSEFFTQAVRRYLEELDAESVTAQIDEVVALLEADDSGRVAVEASRRRLAESDDAW